MPTITYIDADGAEHVLNVPVGRTVMEGARHANLKGIAAECGGACACATCHVHVPEDWVARLPPIAEMESDMLDFAESRDQVRSRLSCQLRITDAYEGLVISIVSE